MHAVRNWEVLLCSGLMFIQQTSMCWYTVSHYAAEGEAVCYLALQDTDPLFNLVMWTPLPPGHAMASCWIGCMHWLMYVDRRLNERVVLDREE